MLTLDDFDENDPDNGVISPYPLNEKQASYFIHLVKLSEITGIILRHQYSVKAESMKKKNKFSIIQHCDMLMGIWFTNLPPELNFSLSDESKQDFFTCLLNAQYYNRLYLIHRSNLIRMARSNSTDPNNYKYPSWGISFQAARMISIITKIISNKNMLNYCPVMFVYIVFSALIMLIYHVDSTNQIISSTASESLITLKSAMVVLSENFPIAKVLLKLFEKYASDQIKRAKVIERTGNLAMKHEMTSAKRAMENQKNLSAYYGKNGNKHTEDTDSLDPQYISPTHLVNSGVSPTTAEPDKFVFNKDPSAGNLEQLINEIKKPMGQAPPQTSKVNTSPSSSGTFPDISLVTENMPDQNFFENFEPTQLFPNVLTSYPPTRAQSPTITNMMNNGENGDNQNSMQNPDEQDLNEYPQTPGETFNINFIDNSYINMNLQSGADTFPVEDIMNSFLNIHPPH